MANLRDQKGSFVPSATHKVKSFVFKTSNEEEEAGETFDVIITKINPPKSEEDESKGSVFSKLQYEGNQLSSYRAGSVLNAETQVHLQQIERKGLQEQRMFSPCLYNSLETINNI